MAHRKTKTGTPKTAAPKAVAANPLASGSKPVIKQAQAAAPVKAVSKPVAAQPAAPQAAAAAAAPVVPPLAAVPEPQACTPVALSAPIPDLVEAAPIAVAEQVVEIAAQTTNQIKQDEKKGSTTMATQANETINAGQQFGKEAADRAQAAFGEMNERTKGAMEKNAKLLQEMSELTKGNVEALVESSRAAAKGVEAISREAADYGRRSFEDASSALKSFAEVRSPADLFRLQSEFARSAFDQMVAESSKMSETVIKLAGEVAEPITNRYSVAADRVKTLAL